MFIRAKAINGEMIIALSGVDSAGKSTQINKLAQYLEPTGRRSVLWYRPGYSAELDALRRAIRKSAPAALPRPGESGKRDAYFRRRWVRLAWLALAIVDMAFQYGIKLRLKMAFGRCVICDRYLEDGLIDLALRFPGKVHTDRVLAKTLRVFCPKPDHAFLLMLPDDMQKARMAAKQEPFPDPESVRLARRHAYEALAASGTVKVIDASRPVGEVFAEIVRAMELGHSRKP